MAPVLPLDLQYQIIDLVLSSGYQWSIGSYGFTAANDFGLKKLGRDRRSLRFLGQCCLVCRDWYAHAISRLYTASRYHPSALLETLTTNKHLADRVRFLAVNCPVTNEPDKPKSGAQLLATARIRLEKLQSLTILEDPHSTPHFFQFCRSLQGFIYPAPRLTHLLYTNGTPALLSLLLASLPHLTSLHVGPTAYSRPPEQSPSVPVALNPWPAAQCKLRELVFQSVYHFTLEASLLSALFESSMSSLERVTFANYGALLNNLLEYVAPKTRELRLTVKENPFNVAEHREEYRLENILTKFVKLEKVHLYVRATWPDEWPDTKHEELQAKFPELVFSFRQSDTDFLDGKINVTA